MVIHCIKCEAPIKVYDIVGLQFTPAVCSEKCFVNFIKKYSHNNNFNYESFSKELKPFRSKWEELVYYKLKELFGNVLYEPFILERKYVPDFYLPDFNLFIEVKGKWNSYSKFALIAQKYPIILLNREVLKRLKWIP